MGNLCAAGHGLVRSEVECRRQGTNSKKRNDKNIAKVLLVDGRVLRFKEPIKAAEVVLAISMGHDYPSHAHPSHAHPSHTHPSHAHPSHAHPPHVQYSSTNFIICPLKPGLQSLSILAPHQHLQLGHLYLLLPSNLILRSTSPDPPPPPTSAAATSTGVNNIITPQLPLQLHYDSAAALDHYPSPHPKMLQRSHHRRSKSAVISGPTAAQVVDFVGPSPDAAAAAAAQIGGAAHSPSLHTSTSPLGSTAAAAAASPPTAAYSDVQLRMRSKSDVGCSGSVSRAAILKNAATTSIKSRGSSYNQDTNYNNHDINMSKSAAAAAAFDNLAKQQQQQLVMGSTAAAAAAQEALYRRHGGSSSYNYNSAQMKKSSSRRKSPSDRSSSSTISSCSGSSRTRAQSIDLGRINGTNHLLLQERALQMNGRSRSSRWATATAANRGVDKVVDAGGVISMGRYGYGHSENGGGNKQAIGGRGADKGAEEKHGSMYRSSRSSSGGSGGGSHGIINSGSPSNFDYSIPAALRRCRSWAPRLQTIEENPASFAYHH